MSLRTEVAAWIDELPGSSNRALVALAMSLSALIDDEPTASAAKELRETITLLAKAGETPKSDDLEHLVQGLSP